MSLRGSITRNDTLIQNVLHKVYLLSCLLTLLLLCNKASAGYWPVQPHIAGPETNMHTPNLPHEQIGLPQPNIQKLIGLLQQATTENKKITAAVLTLTLGMLGVHRIYLGTAPYIPAVYLFTFGGGFFVLPLIDLVMIISSKDLSQFENNTKVLMWAGD